MSKKKVVRKHFVSLPVFIVFTAMLMIILVLAYFLHRSIAENVYFKQQYQQVIGDETLQDDAQGDDIQQVEQVVDSQQGKEE